MHTAGNAPAQEICKIHVVGDVVFANAGLIRDEFSGFDLAALAAQALSAHSSVAQSIESFDDQVSAFLRRFLVEIQNSFPGVYKSFDHNPGISIVFGRIVRRKPTIYVRSFSSVEDPHGSISVQVFKHDCLENCQESVVGLGHFQEMYQYLQRYPSTFSSAVDNGAASSIRLLQLEAAAYPAEVGPPYAVLMVSSAGNQWIAPGACEARSSTRSVSRRH